MKILFDHQIFSTQRYGGISRYFANVYHAIQKQEYIQASIAALYTENHYLEDFKGILSNGIGDLLLSKPKRRYKWNKQYARYMIGKNNFDVLHPTYYHPYFLKNLKKPYVITVHDMIHELMPEFFNSNDLVPFHKRLCLENAAHIIAISQTTKRDLQQIFGIEDSRITVIHHGYEAPTNSLDFLRSENDDKYLLFVGDRAAYKNFAKLVGGIKPLLTSRKDISLLCTGGGPFQIAEVELLKRLGLEGKVRQVNATEDELKILYANAIAFVFPSLYEGFGLPILEAYQNNCPVIASDTDCFKEIMGEACQYFDPRDAGDMLEKITCVVESEQLRTTLKVKGAQQLLNFSMEKCMEKTIQVYRNLV